MRVNLPTISSFINSTTTHGFNRIYNSNTAVRFMWLAFVLATLSGFSYHLVQLITNYMTTPVTTKISPNTVLFQVPDIAVCPTGVFSYTAGYDFMTKLPELFNALKNQAFLVAQEALNSGVVSDLASAIGIVRNYVDSNAALYYASMRKEHFIVKCTYKRVNCSFRDFREFFGPSSGRCFLFEPSDSILNETKEVDEFSLELVLFTDENPTYLDRERVNFFPGIENAGISFDSTYDVTKHGGVLVFYAEKGYYPRHSTKLPTGVHSFVDIRMEEYHYQNTLSKPCIPEPYFFYYDNLFGTRVKFRGSKMDCQYRKLHELIKRNCDCSSYENLPYLSADEVINLGEKNCHRINSSNPAEYNNRMNCVNHHYLLKSTLFNQADCANNCQERMYSGSATRVSWPLTSLAMASKNALMQDHIDLLKAMNITVPYAFYYMKNNLTTIKDVQQKFFSNFARISVGASKSFSMLVEETMSYPISRLFSDIGSILGLYIGMSVLSICELFELVLVLGAELRAAYRGHKARIAWRTKSQTARNELVAAATRVQSIDHAESIDGADD